MERCLECSLAESEKSLERKEVDQKARYLSESVSGSHMPAVTEGNGEVGNSLESQGPAVLTTSMAVGESSVATTGAMLMSRCHD